jgi:HlyD family secretion protein
MMNRTTRKRLMIGGIAAVVLLGLVWAFIPKPVPVRTATVQRGPLQQVVEQEGKTEVVDRYAISAPVPAFLRRITLEVGDRVVRGQPVVRLEPPRSAILDPRSREEAAARVDAARAPVRQAEAAAARALADRQRTERLAAGGSATRQALDQATADATEAAARLTAARADLEAAQAALSRAQSTDVLPVQQVLLAPSAGRVLAVRRRSEGQVNPGDTLVVVGNTNQLQVRADVLSDDAVRIRPGTRVLVEQWGGDAPLQAVVRSVEPQGFTAVSSLGVEEQRVPVVADLTSPPALWEQRLGSGYRVLARFVVWESPAALQLPTSALFRLGDGWAVFVVADGRAQRRKVVIGHQTGLMTEIVSGLQAGEPVIVHPGNGVEDGVRVDPQPDE